MVLQPLSPAGNICSAVALLGILYFVAGLEQEPTTKARCLFTKGDWCDRYHQQVPTPVTPAPQGAKTCPGDCLGRGICNADQGTCDCKVGWAGSECAERQLRPCTNRYRTSGTEPASHVGPDGRDLRTQDPGWTASRCTGWCDVEVAMCWCPPDTKYGYVPAPEHSPPGTPPIKYGRQMIDCMPGTDSNGKRLSWGRPAMPWEMLFGPDGWCQKEDATPICGGCTIDGITSDCTRPTEATCLNQCSGHGTCMSGWCACTDGWYGHDCARPKKGVSFSPGLEQQQSWLRHLVVQPLEAQVQPKPATRRRPLIYVYDLPNIYNTRIKQYAALRDTCGWRWFDDVNITIVSSKFVYAAEQLLHELLLQSVHRTLDPEQADFFYVPVWSSCYSWPVFGWADFPWFHTPHSGFRAAAMSRMHLDAKRWVQSSFPYWDRKGGRDHIFFFSHDEGACWAPTEVWPAIILTHWGRMDEGHKSNTAYMADNYNLEVVHPELDPDSFLGQISGHPCYDPNKDLVLPAFKAPSAYLATPHFRAEPLKHARDILLLLRGDVGKHRMPNYSRGIRQKLFKMSREHKWDSRFNVKIGSYEDVPGDYSELLSSSKFCVVAPGDGWSARFEDSVLHGCIPVIIKDDVHDVFESIIDIEQFSVRVKEADLLTLPQMLKRISEEKLQEMQLKLAQIWHRFAWTSHPLLRRELMHSLEATRPDLGAAEREQLLMPLLEDDAFSTLIQWLGSRIVTSTNSSTAAAR